MNFDTLWKGLSEESQKEFVNKHRLELMKMLRQPKCLAQEIETMVEAFRPPCEEEISDPGAWDDDTKIKFGFGEQYIRRHHYPYWESDKNHFEVGKKKVFIQYENKHYHIPLALVEELIRSIYNKTTLEFLTTKATSYTPEFD